MKIKQHIPNLITLLNLSLGFLAILINDPFTSPLLILLASIFDLLDGLFARLLNARSEIGEFLDSLADLISFGVAPAFLYYHHILGTEWYSMLIVTLVPVAAAIRLAKFNSKPEKELHFRGLPSPSAGLFLSFFVLGINEFIKVEENEVYWLLIPVIIGTLMLTNFKMLSLKHWDKKSPTEWALLSMLGIGIILLFILYQFAGIWLMVLLYLIISLGYNLINPN